MGGLSTAVSEQTVDVFFEAAFWPQEFMAGRARSYGLHTDASLRFERGVDPHGQVRAVERATALLLGASGGDAGPLVHDVAPKFLPTRESVTLRRSRLAKLLGLDIEDDRVSEILTRLGFEVTPTDDGWDVANHAAGEARATFRQLDLHFVYVFDCSRDGWHLCTLQ